MSSSVPYQLTQPEQFQRLSQSHVPGQRQGNANLLLIVAILVSAVFGTAGVALGFNRAVVLALEYLVWTVAGAVVMMRLKQPRKDLFRSRIHGTVTWYLLGLFVSTFLVWVSELRQDINAVFPQMFALCYLALPFYTLERAAKSLPMDRIMMIACHALSGLCMLSIFGQFFGLLNFEGGYGRYFGFLGDQVAWVLILPLIVYFASGRLMLAAPAAIALGLTASRGPSLCVAGALVLLLLFARGHRAKYVGMLVPLVLLLLYQSNAFATLLGRIGTTQFGANDRVATAWSGLRLFQRSPVFGNGYNALMYFFPHSHSRSLATFTQQVQTSTFVQTLSEGGLMWFLSYFAFVIACTGGAIRLMRNPPPHAQQGVTSGLAAWLVVMLWINQSAGWILVGSCVAPLVFGVAGVVSGYWARLNYLERLGQAPRRI